MKILIDINLSPDWVVAFEEENIESVHWSTIGDPSAEDEKLIEYARDHGYIISRTIWILGQFCRLQEPLSKRNSVSRSRYTSGPTCTFGY